MADVKFTVTTAYNACNTVSISVDTGEKSLDGSEYSQARVVEATANQEFISVAKKSDNVMVLPMDSYVLN